jgi:hypothetical protein
LPQLAETVIEIFGALVRSEVASFLDPRIFPCLAGDSKRERQVFNNLLSGISFEAGEGRRRRQSSGARRCKLAITYLI